MLFGSIAKPFSASVGEADAYASTEFQVSSLPGGPVQVFLIAPALVAWGLQRLIQTASPRIVVVGAADRPADALVLLERNPPDLIVLDMDDGYGVEDIARLYDQVRVNILALGAPSEPGFVESVLAAGARGVLGKRETPSALLRAIDQIGNGELFATAADTGRLFTAAARKVAETDPGAHAEEVSRIASLTSRERQTIAAVTSDASAPVKVIADRLCISEHTLRNHLTSIYSKLGVTGRLGLYAYASRHALNRPGAAPRR